jgi:hypothetical protein
MKTILYLAVLVFLLLPGSIRESFILYLGGYGFPIFLIFGLLYFVPVFFRNLDFIDFLFLIIYLLIGLSIIPDGNKEIIIYYILLFLLLRLGHLLIPKQNKNLSWSIALFIFGISLQLLLQFFGIYKVDYGDMQDVNRFHTSAGDSNFSGYLLAYFFYVFLKIQKINSKYLNFIVSIFVISGVLITESRGATLLLLPNLFRLLKNRGTLPYFYILIIFIAILIFSNTFNLFYRWNLTDLRDFENFSSGRVNRVESIFIDAYNFNWFGKNKFIVPHFYDAVPSTYAPHNWYIAILLNFGVMGIVVLIIGLGTLMTESYFINPHVIFLFILTFYTGSHE